MRRERSAGVIVFRHNGADADGGPLFLLLDYGRHWDYPKGHLEKGEDDRTAALRELAEETGITDVTLLDGFSHEIVYFFTRRKGGRVRKEVVFFVAESTSESIVLSDEHQGYAWLPLGEALERVTFDNARNVLSAAARFLGLTDAPPAAQK